jgi:electron transfer flavoprotein alpha subunit
MPNSITIDPVRCIGCTSCVPVCPVNCISMVDRKKEENVRWKKLAVIDENTCVFCNACVEVCDKLGEKSKNKDWFHAITMVKEEVEGTTAVDTSLYRNVWCYAESRHGGLVPTIYELLFAGRQLAKDLNEELCAVLMGSGVTRHAQDLIDHGVDKVYVFDDPMFEQFVDETYANALVELVRREKPNKFLLPASTIGRSFGSRVAVTAHAGITADATELGIDPKTRMLHATRPSFGGNLMATILCEKHRPEMATVRPMAFPRMEKQPGHKGQIIPVALNASQWKRRERFVRFEPEKEQMQDITQAEVIVSGGRGVGGPGGFKPITDLAKALRGSVGASRAAVDAGWIPYRHQIGLTGRTVKPKLYIACGISGQIQHLAGMSSSEVIVAINKDPDAPLMKMATVAVEGDLFELIPAIINELKK